MPVLRMGDLAESIIDWFAPIYGRDPVSVERKVVGIRAGEKMYELLMSEDEAAIALEVEEMFIIPPHIEIPHRGMIRRTYEGAKPAPKMGYDSRRDLPMGRRAIQDMLRVTFPQTEQPLERLPVPALN
jgi:UDP-N-acetylglucosamine 4,6-dehydratase/5-epimerase